MKIIKPSYEIIREPDPLKKIELVARTCYKSEDKITDESAPRMVESLIKNGHHAMLEHASFCFEMEHDDMVLLEYSIAVLARRGFESFLRFSEFDERPIMSANARALIDFFTAHNNYFGSIPYMFKKFVQENEVLFGQFEKCFESHVVFNNFIKQIDPDTLTDREKLIHKDVSVRFIVDRGVSHEIVRHRKSSFGQESTRFCNYGNDDNGITVIEPFFLNPDGKNVSVDNWSERYGAWRHSCEVAEESYLRMMNDGCTPQEARDVLPTSLKTEIVMTTNLQNWQHFFNLRAIGTTGKPHPQMAEVAVPLHEEFKKEFSSIE